MGKAMLVTVGTGQTGDDIAGAIYKSVEAANPDRILFVMTEKSRGEVYVPFLSGRMSERVKSGKVKVEEKLLPDPDDVDGIYRSICLFLEGLFTDRYTPDEIVVDYTSGTKAMSAGAVLAAVAKGIGTLSYVSGKRGDGGRVIPGTEKVLTISPKEAYADRLVTQALQLFARYQYEAGLTLLQMASTLHQDPEFQKKLSFLEKAGKAYWNWDRFLLTESADQLHQLMETAEYKDFLVELQMINQVSANRGMLNKEKEDSYAPERACDLLENARRRYEEGKYDDAMARLYRFVEFLAQMRLKTRRGLNPSNLELSKLPQNLKDKYNHPNRFEKIQVACYECYQLLADLEDPCGEMIQRKPIARLLEKRNHSILAHGFETVKKEDAEEALAFFSKSAEEFIPNFHEMIGKVKFPQFPERAWEKLRGKTNEVVGRI